MIQHGSNLLYLIFKKTHFNSVPGKQTISGFNWTRDTESEDKFKTLYTNESTERERQKKKMKRKKTGPIACTKEYKCSGDDDDFDECV